MNRDRQGTFSIQIDDRLQTGTLESCLGKKADESKKSWIVTGAKESYRWEEGRGAKVRDIKFSRRFHAGGKKGRYDPKSLKPGRT